MVKIYNDAKDMNVAVVKLFADADNDIFYDAACTQEVAADDTADLFYKGVVCVKAGVVYTAKSYNESAKTIDFGFPTA